MVHFACYYNQNKTLDQIYVNGLVIISFTYKQRKLRKKKETLLLEESNFKWYKRTKIVTIARKNNIYFYDNRRDEFMFNDMSFM